MFCTGKPFRQAAGLIKHVRWKN